MAYKQKPGRENMPKTGRGVDTVALMTGSPAMQKDEKLSNLQKIRNFVEPGYTSLGNQNSSRQLFDADGDGDTMFNDSNNDGTMLSRAVSNFAQGVKRAGKAIANDLLKGGAESKRQTTLARRNASPNITLKDRDKM